MDFNHELLTVSKWATKLIRVIYLLWIEIVYFNVHKNRIYRKNAILNRNIIFYGALNIRFSGCKGENKRTQ